MTVIWKQSREFKINEAKAAVGLAVSDVAHVRVVVADAEFFQFGEQFAAALGIEMFDTAAAIGGDDAKFFVVGFEQARDKIASACFEMAKDFYFAFEAGFGVRAVVGLDDPAIEGKVHRRPEGIFDVQHRAESRRIAADYRA
jgi:hypothetical protein